MRVKEMELELCILIIEDNPGDLLIIKQHLSELKDNEYVLRYSSTLAESLNIIKNEKIDAVILDLGLPDSSGLESLNLIKASNDNIPIIVLTINKSDKMGLDAIKNGAQDYLIKDELNQFSLNKAILHSISRKKLEVKLKNSVAQYNNTFEQAAVGIVHTSINTDFLKVNQKFCEILGYSKDELIGKNIADLTFADDLERSLFEMEKLIQGKVKHYSMEKRLIHKNNTVIWTNLTRSAIFDDQNNFQYFFSTYEDITERKILESELQKQKDLLDNVINILPVGVWIMDGKGALIRNNQEGEEIWEGKSYKDTSSLKEYKGWWKETNQQIDDEDWALQRALKNKETSIGEIINIECFDGSKKTIINSALPIIKDGKVAFVVVVNQDITTLQRAEEKMKELISAKEMLLKEAHHRIKNNLQLMSSLLHLPLAKIEDESAKNILVDSIHRIMSISSLHDFLYRSTSFNEVNAQSYLYKIIDHITVSLPTESKNVKFAKDIENFNINSGLAISLGLIINEMVTNAFKYAFNNKTGGNIYIELKKQKDDVLLTFKDDGVGIEQEIDFENVESTGFQIIHSLVSQHAGTINYNTNNGTEFIIKMARK